MNTNQINAELYPFYVSERDDEGRRQFSRPQTQMHGFSIVSKDSMQTRFFAPVREGGVANGSKVFEIRVKSNAGEWQNWQAIVGDFQIISAMDTLSNESTSDLLADTYQRLRDNFEIRYSGILWRAELGHYNEVQIVEEESELIKRVRLNTFHIAFCNFLPIQTLSPTIS